MAQRVLSMAAAGERQATAEPCGAASMKAEVCRHMARRSRALYSIATESRKEESAREATARRVGSAASCNGPGLRQDSVHVVQAPVPGANLFTVNDSAIVDGDAEKGNIEMMRR